MDTERLVERAKAGDSEAFGELYRMMAPKMRGVCIKTLQKDNGVVDDLVHDAFLLAFASIGKLRDPRRFSEWLTTITRNVTLRYLDNGCRLETVPLDGVAETASGSGNGETPYGEDVDSRAADLVMLMQQLPKGYREVLEMSVIQGLSHREIADILGIEPHSSSSQLSRAKQMMRRLARDYWYAPLLLIGLVTTLWLWLFPNKENKGLPPREIAKNEDGKKPINTPQNSVPTSTDSLRTTTDCTENTDSNSSRSSVKSMKSVVDIEQALAVVATVDSLEIPELDDIHIAMEQVAGSREQAASGREQGVGWELLLSGGISPALAQSAYQLLVSGSATDAPTDSDDPSPTNITSWTEFYDYIVNNLEPSPSNDNLMMIAMANIKNNDRSFVQHEDHQQPISIGLSFAKKLSERWSVESGIDYTQLRSTFTLGENGYCIRRQQKLHYVGVPLRMSYKFAAYKQLSAYASAGVTLHIPVGGSIKESYILNYKPATYSLLPTPSTLQWSTTTSLGVQFELLPHLNLYAEPTLEYHIPTSNEVKTIWTEKPVTVTLPFGLRFTW